MDTTFRNRWCLQSSPVPGSTLLGMFWDNAPLPAHGSSSGSSPLFLSSELATTPSWILPYCDGTLPTSQGKASSHQDLILFAVCAWVTVGCLLPNPWVFTLENSLFAPCRPSPLVAFPSQSESQKIKQNYPLKQKQNHRSYYIVWAGLELPI